MNSAKPLQQIRAKTRENRQRGLPSLAVFDLDSTLFDVGPRLERIMADFAAEPSSKAKFPEQVQALQNLRIHRRDWGIKNALERAGLNNQHPEFLHALRDYWKSTFFSNPYLNHDVPYPGAVEFVQDLHQAGAEIVYLTGRDVARMGTGSEEVLRKWNFPLDQTATLALKPHLMMNDAQFKTDWFLDLPKKHYGSIWFFENEPVNIHHLRSHASKMQPPVEILFFDSTHCGEAETPEDLPSIMHFLLEEGE